MKHILSFLVLCHPASAQTGMNEQERNVFWYSYVQLMDTECDLRMTSDGLRQVFAWEDEIDEWTHTPYDSELIALKKDFTTLVEQKHKAEFIVARAEGRLERHCRGVAESLHSIFQIHFFHQ